MGVWGRADALGYRVCVPNTVFIVESHAGFQTGRQTDTDKFGSHTPHLLEQVRKNLLHRVLPVHLPGGGVGSWNLSCGGVWTDHSVCGRFTRGYYYGFIK